MHGWQGWLCLAWGLFVPGLGIALLIWINIKTRGNRVFCMACLRVRISPVHGLVRLLGLCPGDKN